MTKLTHAQVVLLDKLMQANCDVVLYGYELASAYRLHQQGLISPGSYGYRRTWRIVDAGRTALALIEMKQ